MRDLYQQNAMLEAICSASPGPAMVIDREGAVRLSNRAASRLFHRSRSALAGERIHGLLAAGSGARLDAMLQRLKMGEAPAQDGDATSVSIFDQDGDEVAMELRGCMTGEDPEAGFMLFLREAPVAFDEEGAVLAKSKFVAMLTHDMRTAFGGVRGSMALLERENLSGNARDLLSGLIASADLLGGLLDEALDLASIESSNVSIDAKPVDIRTALEEVATIWRPQIESKGLTCSLSIRPDIPGFVRADDARLRQIVGNVVSNAAKYTDQGEVRISCHRARLEPSGEGILIRVDDTGRGFSAEALQTLFKPFSKTQMSRKNTGLGLSIVKTLTEKLGGRVDVTTSPLGGARVDITLPATNETPSAFRPETPPLVERPATPATPEPQKIAEVAPSRPKPIRTVEPHLEELVGKRIMLAEDNATNQMVASQMLESLGCVVEIANDGREALDMMEPDRFDMLLVDIEMPRVSGLDVIRHVRSSEPAIARLPTVALTAYAMREHREKIREAGADGLIAKPILSIEAFGEELVSYLHRVTPQTGGPPKPKNSDELIDSAVLDDLAATIGPEAMRELLNRVIGDLSGVRIDLSRGDIAGVQRATHVLVSVAGAIGATALFSNAERLNRAVAQGAVRDWAKGSAELLTQIDVVTDEVQRVLIGRYGH